MSYTFKRFEDLEFSDDFMFKKVMENKDICKRVIERLLHIKVSDITYPELEKKISPYYTSRGVRLDVYVKDSERVFDLEIQTYREEALGKRMRYYQSMVDIDSLMKGDDYTDLKESYIVFICLEKPFEDADRSVYTFKNLCEDNSFLALNDKSTKVVYNASAYENETDPEIQAFLKFIRNQSADDDLTDKIKQKIADIKRMEANKTEYMSMNLHDSDLIRRAKAEGLAEGELLGKEIGLAEGKLEGAQNNKIETARKLFNDSIPLEAVVKYTGLSIDEARKIEEEIKLSKQGE